MDISRRQFLQKAGLIGGAALGMSALPGCNWLTDWPVTQPLGTILSRPGAQSPIDHIVVVMMENRSFDHYLGYLAADEAYLGNGLSRWGAGFHVDGAQDQTYPDPQGNLVATAHLSEVTGETNQWQGCGFNDPNHGWTSGRAQRDGGFLAAGANDDRFALGYYDAGDLPFTESLARTYTAFDHSHASVLGPTYPNRYYLHSGQAGGNKSNTLPPAGGWGWPLIWDKLAAANVPSRYFYTDAPFLALFGQRGISYSSPIAQYHERCANGTLPNVTMVDPGFVGATQCDDHPLADVRLGQRFLRDVFKAFVESPHWEHGAFIVTYDEWGGFFDHVAPPHFPDDRRSANDADDFSQAGFRVPTLLASPYAKPGYVDHRPYDHSSILRFIEWRFLGAPSEGPVSPNNNSWYLGLRDRNANNIGASLAPTIIDLDPAFDLDLPLDEAGAACGTEAGSLRALQSTSGDDAFDEETWRTYLSQYGFTLP